jgi:hypothetical protein
VTNLRDEQNEPWRDKVVDLAARRSRRALLRTAGHSGWNARPGAPQWTPRTPLHFYLLDTVAQKTVMGVVNWEDLAEIEESTRALSWQETMDALTGMLAEDDADKIHSAEGRSNRNELLITLAVRYVTATATFGRVPGGTVDAHFIVLVYRPKGLGDPEGILRPFALVARNRQGLLQPDEMSEIARRVTEQDRAGHPDWFPLASVHPLAPDRK